VHLSKLILNTNNSQVRQDIGNPHKLHRTIMRSFPVPLPEDERVLFRIESFDLGNPPVVLVQSLIMPVWDSIETKFRGYFARDPEIKSFDGLKIYQGDVFRFRLRANPTKRVFYKATGKNQRISLFSEQDRKEWLARKVKIAGFSVNEDRLLVRDAPYRKIFISKEDKTHKATINMVDFDGLLNVEEPEKFLKSVREGIGSAKGLGCGLLSIART
jgi:CRISPR system Cascade subunit CasE